MVNVIAAVPMGMLLGTDQFTITRSSAYGAMGERVCGTVPSGVWTSMDVPGAVSTPRFQRGGEHQNVTGRAL